MEFHLLVLRERKNIFLRGAVMAFIPDRQSIRVSRITEKHTFTENQLNNEVYRGIMPS